MHWVFWAFLACLLFSVTYNPRTGRLGKLACDSGLIYFTPERVVEDNAQRTTQSNRDSSVPRE
jgi:hypothetical protein